MSEYNLVYTEKETGKKYYVKRITPSDFIILDPETEMKETITRYRLGKNFFADKENTKRKGQTIKNNWSRVRYSA